jgi:hypothetical protein
MNITKAWVTPREYSTCTLSINTILDEFKPHMKPDANILVFPAEPTPEHPKQQTITIGLLDEEDLWKIKKAVDKILLGLTFDE